MSNWNTVKLFLQKGLIFFCLLFTVMTTENYVRDWFGAKHIHSVGFNYFSSLAFALFTLYMRRKQYIQEAATNHQPA